MSVLRVSPALLVLQVCLPAFQISCGLEGVSSHSEHASRRAVDVRVQLGVHASGARVQVESVVAPGDARGQPLLAGPALLWVGTADAQGQVSVTVEPEVSRGWLRITARTADGAHAGRREVLIEDAGHVQVDLQPVAEAALPPNSAGAVARRVWPDGLRLTGSVLDAWRSTHLEVLTETEIALDVVRLESGVQRGLGYFVVDAQGRIEPGHLVYEDLAAAKGEVLLRDDAGQARRFAPGERVHLFILPAHAPIDPDHRPPHAYAVGNYAADVATTLPAINPEASRGARAAARRTVAVEVGGSEGRHLLVGFEDLGRTAAADDDFDDIIVALRPQRDASVATVGFVPVDAHGLDADHDGVSDLLDAFSADRNRAATVRVPSRGFGTLAVEAGGDRDFNDAVVCYAYEVVLDADGLPVEMQGTFHLVAGGGDADLDLELRLPGLAKAEGWLVVEGPNGAVRRRVALSELPSDGVDLFVQDILPSTFVAFGATPSFTHEDWSGASASARVRVVFDAPEAVRLPEAYFMARGEGEIAAPRLLDVPGPWSHPAEGRSVNEAYPNFDLWQRSQGAQAADWYRWPRRAEGLVIDGVDLSSAPWASTVAP